MVTAFFFEFRDPFFRSCENVTFSRSVRQKLGSDWKVQFLSMYVVDKVGMSVIEMTAKTSSTKPLFQILRDAFSLKDINGFAKKNLSKIDIFLPKSVDI